MIVLDTHIWHWWVNSIPGKLPPVLLKRLGSEVEIGVSIMSCVEMAWLVRRGRIELPCSIREWFDLALTASAIQCLSLTPDIAALAAELPEHHKDPADRLIIATALAHSAELVSFDDQFPLYDELQGRLVTRAALLAQEE